MEIAISIKIGFPTIVNSVPYYFHSKDFEKDFQCFMRIVFVYLGWDGNYEEKTKYGNKIYEKLPSSV